MRFNEPRKFTGLVTSVRQLANGKCFTLAVYEGAQASAPAAEINLRVRHADSEPKIGDKFTVTIERNQEGR